MNYRINFHASASAQIPGLPAEAFTARIETLLQVGADPYGAGLPDLDEPDHRQAVFAGVGLVWYRIDDAAKIVHVYHVMWAG